MDFHKIWEEQCEATRTIRERFGIKNALDYLIGEKLLNFARAADQDPDFAAELPRFQAAVWEIFNPYELRGYVASLKPAARKKLQKLLYVSLSCPSWNWRERSSVKITERAHAKRAKALHWGRESCHPKAALAG